MTYFFSLSLQ